MVPALPLVFAMKELLISLVGIHDVVSVVIKMSSCENLVLGRSACQRSSNASGHSVMKHCKCLAQS